MSFHAFTSVFAVLYLTVASVGILPYALLSSDFERFFSRSASFELIALAFLLVITLPRFGELRWSKMFFVFVSGLMTFVSVNSLAIFTEGRSASSISVFLGIAAAFIAGAAVSRISRAHNNVLKYWPPLASGVIVCILLWLFFYDGISYPEGVLKPLLAGGIASTELSNIAAVAIIAIYYQAQPVTVSRYIGLLPLVLVQLWCLSVGTFFALAFVYVCVSIMITGIDVKIIFRVTLWLCVCVCLIIVILALLIDSDNVNLYWLTTYLELSYSNRILIYEHLKTTALHNYLTGIGLGKFYMPPHHNILGLAAETGVVSAALYGVFTICALTYSFFAIRRGLAEPGGTNSSSRILIVFFGIALFLWLKGFVHDTWQDKITYFCMGFIINYHSRDVR